ncbi:MAG: DUF1574 family protein [Lachnospiraceae bacterium]|nr:DUF1574 family protein [Lachnospiraceae bacterium]
MGKIIKVFVFCAVAMIVILGVDYYVDSYASVRVTYDGIAQISENQNYYVGTDIALSERRPKWARINRMPRYQFLILGSSRMVLLTKEDMNQESFYNLAVSGGCSVNDYLAQIYILYLQNKLPDEILMEVSPLMFNANSGEARYLEWDNNTEYMKQVLAESVPEAKQAELGIQWKDLLSPSYFQYNFQNLLSHKRAWVKATDSCDNPLYTVVHKDGSYLYGHEYQYKYTEEDIIKETEKIYADHSLYGCENYSEINADLKKWFEELILFLQERGVKVSFYLPPYSGQMYEFIMREERYEMIPKTEEYIVEFAGERNIDVFGSYDPENSNLTMGDFYDPYHIKKEKIMDTLWRR